MLVGTVATNCDDCSDVHTTNPPVPVTPDPGTSVPVPGCVGKIMPDNLNAPSQCVGMNLGGAELKPFSRNLSRCPDGDAYAAGQRFQIYWTICNTAAATPTTLLPYKLEARTVAGGVEATTPVLSLDFTQRALAPCDCQTEIVVFNSTEAGAQNLGPGAYRLRLSGIYGPGQANFVNLEMIVINP
jgi:hypothetical protein